MPIISPSHIKSLQRAHKNQYEVFLFQLIKNNISNQEIFSTNRLGVVLTLSLAGLGPRIDDKAKLIFNYVEYDFIK